MANENIAKAIISVMKNVKGIDKSMTVGTGLNAYSGVSDKDVKKVVGDAMSENGLCILPIDVQAVTKIDRWDEVDPWSKSFPKDVKSKQSIFTEVTTKYLLLHESGESIELSGYGQGVDPQDKGAGKATTYALKYTLLYLFMIPTGKIDDSELMHSDNHAVPPPPPPNKKTISDKAVNGASERILKGEVELREKLNEYALTAAQVSALDLAKQTFLSSKQNLA